MFFSSLNILFSLLISKLDGKNTHFFSIYKTILLFWHKLFYFFPILHYFCAEINHTRGRYTDFVAIMKSKTPLSAE